MPETRTDARTDEEELVKRYILNNADKDADKVRFLRWGPHMDKQEVVELAKEAGVTTLFNLFRDDLSLSMDLLLETDPAIRTDFLVGPIEKKLVLRSIARVRYEGPASLRSDLFGAMLNNRDPNNLEEEKTYDDLYFVYPKRVILLRGKEASDDWKQKLRKELSKRFPGIKR